MDRRKQFNPTMEFHPAKIGDGTWMIIDKYTRRLYSLHSREVDAKAAVAALEAKNIPNDPVRHNT